MILEKGEKRGLEFWVIPSRPGDEEEEWPDVEVCVIVLKGRSMDLRTDNDVRGSAPVVMEEVAE